MVKSKKQEIFRKLNSTSGVGDSDVGKWVLLSPFKLTRMHQIMKRTLLTYEHDNLVCLINVFFLIVKLVRRVM